MGDKRKQTRAADLVGTVYKGFKVLDCKTENRRSFLQVECPYCKKIKWILSGMVRGNVPERKEKYQKQRKEIKWERLII